MRIGAHYQGNGLCEFRVWAPTAGAVSVRLFQRPERIIPLKAVEGYWRAVMEDVPPGTLYQYRVDHRDRPDPASHAQPLGVHGPSQVIDHDAFAWEDRSWRGTPLSDWVIYELHVGAFTPEGTFDAVIPRLDALKELGITALELMPVAPFPGERNWGYDGVYPFAVQHSYGGPDGLKRLVNACHQRGLAVILDVVYNHLGPEGNYLHDFAPYFTDKYRTPWGAAVNFDDAHSDGVRNYWIENALHWFRDYHLDALRLDAIHAIFDESASPFLMELAEAVHDDSERTGRKRYLIPESDRNDARVIHPPKEGGYDYDAQWCDDFHHALHTLITGEKDGYYADFGEVGHLVKAFREGFVYSGQYSRYRKRRHGSSSKEIPCDRFIVFSQNHDQVGNRRDGARLSRLAPFEALKLAAGIVMAAPYLPLLFMGEEYGEEAPFLYFVDHSDPDLVEAVRNGRKEEFRAFGWPEDPPDPQRAETFLRSKIDWSRREEGRHRTLLEFHRTLIRLRRELSPLAYRDKDRLEAWGDESTRTFCLRRWTKGSQLFCAANFHREDRPAPPFPKGDWKKILDSADKRWDGPGSGLPEILRGVSFALYLDSDFLE